MSIHQHRGRRLDRLTPPHRPDALTRLRLEVDPVDVGLQQRRQPFTNCRGEPRQPRRFGKDDHVEIDDGQAQAGQFITSDLHEPAAVGTGVLRIGIGKPLADVSKTPGTQKRIGDGVKQHVGITVPNRSTITGNLDTPDPERSSRFETVGVVADPDPHAWSPAADCYSNTAIVRPRGDSPPHFTAPADVPRA